MKAREQQVAAGQAVYTKRVLGVYDFVVLGVSNRLIWRCPTQRLLDLYNNRVTANHLDVGVGTGYFLDHCQFPSPSPRIALVDLNRNALDYTAKRIQRYRPETYVGNVLEPLAVPSAKFDSIGINYLLHCIPGSMESKSVAFDNLKKLMNPRAVIFGSTLLQDETDRNWGARRLMSIYNKKGIFCNRDDTLEDLSRALHARFQNVSIKTIGCVAIFQGVYAGG